MKIILLSINQNFKDWPMFEYMPSILMLELPLGRIPYKLWLLFIDLAGGNIRPFTKRNKKLLNLQSRGVGLLVSALNKLPI